MKKTAVLISILFLVSFFSTAAGMAQFGLKKKKDDNDPVLIKKSRAASGAKEGAKIGAMAGTRAGAMGGSKKSTAAGAAGGAMIGAMAGYAYGAVKDRQLKSRDEAVAKYEYTPEMGVMLVIETLEAAPSAITRGGTLEFKAVYTVLAPSESDSIDVNLGFGVVLAELSEESDEFQPGKLEELKVQRGGGTFEVTVPLADTSGYEPHSYKYIVGAKAGDAYAQEELVFNITG